MPRWAKTAQNDEPLTQVGDNAFYGLDMKTRDPAAMKPGTYREAYNVRSENGSLVTRGGSLMPGSFNYANYNRIFGVEIFSNPDGLEWLAVAVKSGVWFVRDGEAPRFVPLEEALTYPVNFVQAFDKFFLFRGPNHIPLVWNGDWSVFWTPFPPPTGGRDTIPNADTGEFYANRLIVPYGKDRIAVSDIGDYTMYDWFLANFQINFGESDSLIRVFPWIKQTLLMFKNHSIYKVSNVYGDLSQTTMDVVSTDRGLVGLKAVVSIGNDVYFMDFTGVYQISQIFENSPQVQALPISDAIKPIINEINWNAAAGIRANARRERLYFAIPLKNAIRNNALIVYNLILQSWESIDTFDDQDFRIDDLVRSSYNNERRLFAIDRERGMIVLLEQGKTDLLGQTSASEYQIKSDVITRGYLGGGPRSNFQRVQLDVSLWNSRYDIDAFCDGGNAKSIARATSSDRTKYEVWGKPKWNVVNLNDDHADAYRQDYSVKLPLRLGYNGVQLEREQEISKRYRIGMFGRYCQLRIGNEQGTFGLRSVIFEGFEDQRQERSQI